MNTQAKASDQGTGTELERLIEAMRDTLSDEMITRLASTLSGSLDMLDRLNRSGVMDALPTLERLVGSGDLDRLAQAMRVLGAMQDTLNDEMIGRLAGIANGGLELLDRLDRSQIARWLPLLDRLVATGALERLLAETDALERLQRLLPRMLDLLEGLDPELLDGLSRSLAQARRESAEAPAALGGVGGFWAILREPENQETIRFFLNFGKHLKNPATKPD